MTNFDGGHNNGGRDPRGRAGGYIDPQQIKEEEAAEEAALLTQDMKSALQESKWLKAALQDSTLCSLISDIHHDPQNDRAKKLRESMQQYPDFEGFVDRLLLEIGALKYEEGRLVLS